MGGGEEPRSSSSGCFRFFLARPRVLYAVIFVWISFTGGRFLAPFLEHEAGLDAAQIGSLLAVQQLIGIPCGSLAGRRADLLELRHPGRGRAYVLGSGIVLGTVAFLLHSATRWTRNGDDVFASTAWFWLLRIVYAVAVSCVFPILDGMCLHFLQQDKQNFGKERLYGAITWALANLCLAPALDRYGFVVTYPLGFLSGVVSLAALYRYTNANMQDGQQQQQQYSHVEKGSSGIIIDKDEHEESEDATASTDVAGNGVSTDAADNVSTKQLLCLLLFRTPGCFGVAFLFAVVLLAVGQSLVESLIFLFFEYLESSFTTMGLTVVLTVAFEVPIFQVADYLLDRFGATRLLQAAMICYMIRVLGYTIIPQGHVMYALFLEPMHGVTYACSQAATVDFVAQSMPVGFEASGQGLVYIFRGLGAVFGLFAGGWTEDAMGPRVLYRSAATFVLAGSLVLAVASWRDGSQARQPVTLDDIELTVDSGDTVDNELRKGPNTRSQTQGDTTTTRVPA